MNFRKYSRTKKFLKKNKELLKKDGSEIEVDHAVCDQQCVCVYNIVMSEVNGINYYLALIFTSNKI